MPLEIASPGDLARLLRGQDVRGLTSLQVAGQTRLDGGLGVVGPADVAGSLTARRLAVTPQSIYEPGSVWKEFPLPNPPNAVGLSNIGLSIGGIPQNFRTLIIDFEGTFDAGSGVGYMSMNFNGDNSAAHYYWERLSWANGAASVIDASTVFSTSAAAGFTVEGQQPYSEGSQRIIIHNYSHADHAGHSYFVQGSWVLNSTPGNYGGYAFGGGWAALTPQGITLVELGYASGGGHVPITGKCTVRLLGPTT